MEFKSTSPKDTVVELHGIEVDVVAAAFRETIALAMKRGNNLQEYYHFVAAWEGDHKIINHGVNPGRIPDALTLLIDNTDEVVDSILDEETDPVHRIIKAARRYELGHHAGVLLEELTEAIVLNEQASEED